MAALGCDPKRDNNLAGASGDFDALEKLRKLAFAEQVPSGAKQLLLPIATDEIVGPPRLS